MLLRIVLLLLSVGVKGLPTSEFKTSEALRKSRQLDLGFQEIIGNTDSTLPKNSESLQHQNIESLLKEYLPPVSPSSSDIVNFTPNQKTLKSHSLSTTEKENLLCKLPFDFILCNKKKNFPKQQEINALDEDIKKPSTDLVPPFNDVNENVFTTVSTKQSNIKSESASEKFSAFNQNSIVSTTKRPFVKKIDLIETAKQSTKYSKIEKENVFLNTAEPSIESRSYLPPQPEFAPAAQTAVEVIRPRNEEEHHHDHHHHHHHHHDENFDICTDAFHSFLCAPLKPRKIITGAFPSNLKGQSSFLKYQKLLPDREELPAPSNTFQNEYLPPKKPTNFEVGASFNSVRTTVPPPKTTPKPFSKVIDFRTTSTAKSFVSPKNLIIPKLQDNIIPFSPTSTFPVIEPIKPLLTTPKPVLFFIPVKTTSYPILKSSSISNEFNSIFIPTITTPKPIFSTLIHTTTTKPLPDKFQSSSSISTIFSNSNTKKPSSALFVPFNPQSTNEDRSYLPPLPSASFISTDKIFSSPESPLVSNKVSSTLPTKSPFSSPQNFQSTTRSTPIKIPVTEPKSTTTKAPLLSNLKFLSTTSKPSTFFTSSASSFSPLASKFDNSYLPPLSKLQPVANSISTTIKPFRPTPKKNVALPNLNERPSNIDRSYLPPDPNVQPAAAAQVDSVAVPPKVQNPFHHGRDLCTDPFHSFLCTAPKPRKRITGNIPSRLKGDSSNTNELKIRPAPSSQKPIVVNLPITQFTTLKPFSKQTFAPSTTEFRPNKPATTTVITTKRPEIFQPSEIKTVIGYDYPKPSSAFPLPSQQQIQISPTTKGYSYPKPQKPFPLPTELKEVVKSTPSPPVLKPSSTNQAKGYQYPKPEQSFELPQKQGYSYPKPQKQLVLPTEKPNKTFSSVDILGNLGSAEFIPVNKLEKRSRFSQSFKFGERLSRHGRRYSSEAEN